MAPWSELITFLGYEPCIQGYRFMQFTVFIASMATFDKVLFACCPDAKKTPPMTKLEDKPPSDHEDSNVTPKCNTQR